MNVNGLINMVIRMVMRNLLNRGVNTAFDMVDRKRAKSGKAQPEQHDGPWNEKGKQNTKQAMRTLRRFKRF